LFLSLDELKFETIRAPRARHYYKRISGAREFYREAALAANLRGFNAREPGYQRPFQLAVSEHSRV